MAEMNYKILIETAMLNMVRDILKKVSNFLKKTYGISCSELKNNKFIIFFDN